MNQSEIGFNGRHERSRHYSGKKVEKEYPRYEKKEKNL
jgi:hypothetical protein